MLWFICAHFQLVNLNFTLSIALSQAFFARLEEINYLGARMLEKYTKRYWWGLQEFFSKETAGGIVLMIVTALALIISNSAYSEHYFDLLRTDYGFLKGHSLQYWINDAIMVLFFLLIGLEIKREFIIGHMSTKGSVLMPAVGALGGMVIPALIYVFFTYDNSLANDGWAIPCATDIAFAVGVLALLGKRVPITLKIFLLALAIFDDLAAIVIIALFYSKGLNLVALAVAAIIFSVMVAMLKLKVSGVWKFLVVGFFLWLAFYFSGVHPTIAGVLLAMCISIEPEPGHVFSPLGHLEYKLHPWVIYLVVPLFAFANAGVNLTNIEWLSLSDVSLGIGLGLLIGKPLGIVLFVGLGIALGLFRKPKKTSLMQLVGIGFLCGIGFTMSLFIANLSFAGIAPQMMNDSRLGILLGSLASAVIGYSILLLSSKPSR